MERKTSQQTIAWFWDHHNRGLLELDPPYQRRSIWNQAYKDYFIDTILLGYPCPPIFLFREISPSGVSVYSVVDGKQRLMTLFEFINDEFPVYEYAVISKFHGKYFKDFDPEDKAKFYSYEFVVDFIPSEDEKIIDDIFNRINKNVARLSRQELRHAMLSGEFITASEKLSEVIFDELSPDFPKIATKSRRQMKDVELAAELLLFIEEGISSYSQDLLDEAFAKRDIAWDEQKRAEKEFINTIRRMSALVSGDENEDIRKSRLKNQADFYSFFASVCQLSRRGVKLDKSSVKNLRKFLEVVSDTDRRENNKIASAYYRAARSASNDVGPRQTRVEIMEGVLTGKYKVR